MAKKSNIVKESAGLKEIPVTINDNQVKDKAKLAADLQAERDDVAARHREINTNFKAQLGDLDRRIHTLLKEIRSGHETREVECEYHIDFDTNSKELVRCDNGEVIEKDMVITAEERQTLIDTPEDHEDPPEPLILTPASGQRVKITPVARPSGFIWICEIVTSGGGGTEESDIIYKSVGDAMFHGLDYAQTEISGFLDLKKIAKGQRPKVEKTLKAVITKMAEYENVQKNT